MRPEEVCGERAPSQCFAFIFIPNETYLDDFCQKFDFNMEKATSKKQKAKDSGNIFEQLTHDKIDTRASVLVTMYHSVPKVVFQNPNYLNILSQFGDHVKHVLDCPESNLPLLTRSRANYLTDSIKQICPHLFPKISIKDKMLLEQKSNEFK